MGLAPAPATTAALLVAVLLFSRSPPLLATAAGTSGDDLFIAREWQALGPFPSGTREWPLTFPDALIPTARERFHRLEYSNESQYPSPLVDGGAALWKTFTARDDGWVNATWPEIQWDRSRTSAGWAGLQHQTLLRTKVIVSAKSTLRATVSLTEGAEWALFPSSSPSSDAIWHTGDTYSYGGADGDPLTLGHLVALAPGEHTIVVRSVYDFRISGDPRASSRGLDASFDGVPVASFKVVARVVEDEEIVHAVQDRTLVSDLLDDEGGKLASRFVGVTLRNLSPDKVTVNGVRPGRLVFGPGQTLQPGQTRHVAVDLGPDARLPLEGTSLLVTGASGRGEWTVNARLRSKVVKPDRPFTYTFLDADGSVQYAKALPPSGPDSNTTSPPLQLQNPSLAVAPSPLSPIVVALHGAGVSVAEMDWWPASVPQQRHSWIVFPTGRTPWGYDWHGPSSVNVERAVEALAAEGGVWERWVEGRTGRWRRPHAGRLVVVGHSNGGQGAWYFASRYPDRVRAVMPAAGYIKIQSYVPYLWASHHVQPPSLAAVLTSSLAPYDNDLHTSNLFDTPLLAIHGADDGNVPVWHGRKMLGLVRSWSGRDDLARRARSIVHMSTRSLMRKFRFEEVPGRDHWWPDVFRHPAAAEFLERVTSDAIEADEAANEFTLTVSNPVESGTLRGFRISQLDEGGTWVERVPLET